MTLFRTVDLIANSITNETFKFIAFFAVVAIDLGVLGWTFLYRSHAQGPQRVVAIVMFIVCLLAVLATQIGDTALQEDPEKWRGTIETISVFIIPLVIVANVGAFALYEIMDPESKVRAALLQAEYTDAMAQAELHEDFIQDLIENRKDAYARAAEGFVPGQAQQQVDVMLGNAAGDSNRVMGNVNKADEGRDWRGMSKQTDEQSLTDQLAQRLGYTRVPEPNGNGKETSPKADKR